MFIVLLNDEKIYVLKLWNMIFDSCKWCVIILFYMIKVVFLYYLFLLIIDGILCIYCVVILKWEEYCLYVNSIYLLIIVFYINRLMYFNFVYLGFIVNYY